MTEKQLYGLMDTYSKNELTSGWLQFVKNFYSKNLNKEWDGVKAYPFAELLASKKQLNKNDTALVCFGVLQNEKIYKAFIATLPEYIRQLIAQLLWEDAISKEKVQELAGKSIAMTPKQQWQEAQLLPELRLLKYTRQSNYYYMSENWRVRFEKQQINFYLPDVLKQILIEYYPKPKGYELKPLAKPGADGKIEIFNAEEIIFTEFPRIMAYYIQSNIKYSVKGIPNAASVNKMQRVLGIKEFFSNKEFHSTRTQLLAGLLYGYKATTVQVDPVQVIKTLFTKNYLEPQNYAPVAPYIFTQLKGINYFYWNEYKANINERLQDILKELPAGQWITYENIKTYVKTHFIDLRPLENWNIGHRIFYDKEVEGFGRSYKEKRYLDPSQFTPMIDEVYLKGNLFLHAAYGLLEIAYNQPDNKGTFGKDWFSEYDGIQSLRLTPLGAYVLGLQSEYEPPVNLAEESKLIFDENALVIRAEGNMELINSMLSNYLEKISTNRYSFNTGLFLKDCKTVKDIKQKITLFKQTINTKLPSFWEDYLSSLLTNAKQFQLQREVFFFSLPTDDKQLQKTVAQDEVLKNIVLKAEQFHIAVYKNNLAKFRNRMKELGYLVEGI